MNLVDRSQEKLELAKELGLTEYVRSKENIARKKAAVAELSKMSFKPVDEDTFKFFPKWVFKWHGNVFFQFFIGIPGIVFLLSGFFAKNLRGLSNQDTMLLSITGGILLAMATLGCLISCIRKVRIGGMFLSNWTDELPCGALLALKEAKEAGVVGMGYDGSYQIYYPKVEERLKADPVITGMYKGIEVVIFAWDDSKTYE